MYNEDGDNMTELFKDIIIGEMPISALNKDIIPSNMKNRKMTEVAKLFVNAARGKYSIGEINKNDLDSLLVEYDKLIRLEKNIVDYVNSNFIDDTSLGLINHIIVVFMDNFVANKQVLSTSSFQKTLTRKIATKGYVEPLLLSLIVIGTSFIFLANLYLNI